MNKRLTWILTLAAMAAIAGQSAAQPWTSPTLTLIKQGGGSGRVTSSPAGIDCGGGCQSASATYTSGKVVALEAQPYPGSVFAGWSLDCSGTATFTSVTMSSDKNCVAAFNTAPPVLLTVSKTGAASGRITSSPPGINCGTACAQQYSLGTVVTLSAQPDPGSLFAGWNGACTDTGPGISMVTMTTATSCTATFISNPAPPVALTVSKTGNGGGTITSNPSGIACGMACTASYPVGTVVTLAAQPDPGSVFSGWTGVCAGSPSSAPVTMTAANSCAATFNSAPPAALTVIKPGTGGGTVTSNPPGIACGTACTQQYPVGTVVTLSAQPDPSSVFAGWGGPCIGTGPGTSVVTMTAAQGCVAIFNLNPASPVILTVMRTGAGGGTVTSNPPGINCGTACTQHYPVGAVVTLTAQPDPGSVLAGWSGACSGTGPSTSMVTMTAAQGCTAIFNSAPLVTLWASKTGGGSGTVTSNPPGINCGTACAGSYPTGAVVTLVAHPDPGWAFNPGSVFSGWSGDCSGTASSTPVTMTATKNCTAIFNTAPGSALGSGSGQGSPVSLTISKMGSGSGTVTSNPPGINCGVVCTASYPVATMVTLTAQPAMGSEFTGWSGDCTGSASSASVTMTPAKNCAASFNAAPKPPDLTIKKQVSCPGRATPQGIKCTITLTIYNIGPGAFNGILVVQDIVTPSPSPGLSAATSPQGWSCNAGPSNTVGCATTGLVALAMPGSTTLSFDVAIPAGQYNNCASVKAYTQSPYTSTTLIQEASSYNNQDCVAFAAGKPGLGGGVAAGSAGVPPASGVGVVMPGKACDLEIKKTLDPNPLVSGQPANVTLTVKNVGDAACPAGPHSGTAVQDSNPGGMTFKAPPTAHQPGWQCALGGSSAGCSSTAPLPPGYSVTFTINATVTAPPGSSVANCATVSNPNDAKPANNKSCVTVNVKKPIGPSTDRIKSDITPRR